VTEDRGKTLIRAGLGKGTTSQLAEKLELRLILGGAAVYRCGELHCFEWGFSR
jgi:cytidylate kinase